MNEVGFLSHTIYKYQLRINYGPKHKCKTLRKKKYENLCSVRFSKNFFNMALKTQVTKVKIDKFEYITSWQIDGETVADFIFLGSKITADGDCSHEIKRRILLGKKAMTNLDSIFKRRDITLSTKVHLVKAMFFPVIMYGCELDYKES